MTSQRQLGGLKPKISRFEVYWTTVTYRTIAVYVVLLFAIAMATLYLIYPDWYAASLRSMSSALGGGSPAGATLLSQNRARFVNLDGKVQVKKVNSVQWSNADYSSTLDKGDLIQTGPDGAARITFADGTTYTVKTDTLVTVEENNVAREHSSTGMYISSGAVDLATGKLPSADSKAEVSFENAVASLRQNSRAAVRSDPSKNQHEITVAAGAAELKRGEQSIQIGKWEKVSFPTGGPVVKTNVLAPPDLVQPLNLQPLIVPDPRQASVRFEWRPASGAVVYLLRVSNTSMFAKVLAERRTNGRSVEVSGLDAGDYFWNVTAIDPHKRSSEASETYKFTLVAHGKGQEMFLEVDGTQLHGNLAEVIGRTEPGAALIVNGQSVANIQPDGRFRHFTEPLARGSQIIVITGQNRRGGTTIKRVPIVVP